MKLILTQAEFERVRATAERFGRMMNKTYAFDWDRLVIAKETKDG